MSDAISDYYTSRKKKFKSKLIPASFFVSTTKQINDIKIQPENIIENISQKPESSNSQVAEPSSLITQKVQLSKSTNEHTFSSGLSLKSIKKKRALEASINPLKNNTEDLPNDPFTFEELKEHWDFCAEQFYKTGRMLMSSTMNMAQLSMDENKLIVEFPNKGSQLSFEENLYDLTVYIQRKLNNYHLKFDIRVNETVEIKKTYTIDDRLNYLKELNPNLETLIQAFDLDLNP